LNNDLLKELKYLDSYESDIIRVHNLVFDLKLADFPNILNPMATDEKDSLHKIMGGRGHLPVQFYFNHKNKNNLILFY